jgi:formate/nitrite transporter FocA (FNT family)
LGLVILGNLIGGILFTLFISLLAPHLNLFTHETMVKIGSHVVDYDAWVLLSAIVAGWLMGLLNWLINSVKTH